jgi:hypothetical protein
MKRRDAQVGMNDLYCARDVKNFRPAEAKLRRFDAAQLPMKMERT